MTKTLNLLADKIIGADQALDVSETVSKVIHQKNVPGAIIAGINYPKKLYIKGCSGVRIYGKDDAIGFDDHFHIGSCTKSITALLFAILVEQGNFKWEAKAFSEEGATIEDLLCHTGGAPEKIIGTPLWDKIRQTKSNSVDQRKIIFENLKQSLFPSAFKYSNTGYAVVGHLIEKTIDRSFEELVYDLIFEKLGMYSFGFGPPARHDTNQPWGHLAQTNPLPIKPDEHGDNSAGLNPAGGLHSSTEDLLRYSCLHLEAEMENPILISPLTFKRIHSPHGSKDYGYGWKILERDWSGGRALHCSGSNSTFFTIIWIAPIKQIACVASCNLGGSVAFQCCDTIIVEILRNHLL